MSEIDDYLAGIEAPERAALDHIRRLVMQVAPEAEEGRSYGMPALKYRKRSLLGFVAAKNHLSVFPFSPSVIETLLDRLDGYDVSKGTIRFTVDNPIPDDVLRDIVLLRLAELGWTHRV
jgi:uncharacterized protein YdhG (YjbR/CyaY superfamily)